MPVFGAFPSDYKITGTNIDGGVNTLGFVTTGTYNIGLGNNSLALLTTGQRNIAIGSNALSSVTTHGDNIAIGHNALALWNDTILSITGSVVIGSNAMGQATAATRNIAIGQNALYRQSATAPNPGSSGANIAIGPDAMSGDTVSGHGNIAIGEISMGQLTSGMDNVGVGDRVLNSITTGSDNVCLGHRTGVLVETGDNNILIGNATAINGLYGTAAQANTIQIGDASHTTVTIGGIAIASKPPVTTVLTGGTPSGIPSSGSVAANGALTVTTAFLETYSDGVWLFFPAGAVYAGSVAGLYWVVMSSTTLGTVYNNVLSLPGNDHPPATLTPIVAAGPGAYTQVVATDITVRSVVMPGDTMGEDGMLTFKSLLRHNDSAGSKTWRASINSTFFASISSTVTTLSNRVCDVYNQRNHSRQISSNWLGVQMAGVTDPVFGTENTSIDQTVSVALRVAVATDWIINLTTIVSAYYGDHP